ncbi:conjugal transfer protein TrbE [Klebsiella quasipneumoniae]|uniref:conjugal transfer protein TrbE n=1 Tax=Klebsiella pneumoniae complex TaxID=3390273 RepID=UPI000E2ACCD4|nr:conjugal transfer protein TrbE [Klebsiella pneumoniae]HDU3708692.1 conjugal transfer protein TrbE [Klebsiella pneumoniae subsp. pneumoniae]MBQ5042999.1 conjugal transfer protein TrbE [Klebsiella pneumoniae]MDT9788773.1 conjugal transfer protein TrbE [Klebsiella pneumoniae]MDT9882955.1 conjugal transfer protein TrbE [Klebsiella pneumoniae]SVP78797.1 conjugal transfer protein TrbE [Klebsiella pneumoniae]
MKMNFYKHPVVDFMLRLVLTIIIISPVVHFSWDAVKGTSGSDYVESVVFIVLVGFFWFVSYLFFTCLERCYGKRRGKNEDGEQV